MKILSKKQRAILSRQRLKNVSYLEAREMTESLLTEHERGLYDAATARLNHTDESTAGATLDDLTSSIVPENTRVRELRDRYYALYAYLLPRDTPVQRWRKVIEKAVADVKNILIVDLRNDGLCDEYPNEYIPDEVADY